MPAQPILRKTKKNQSGSSKDKLFQETEKPSLFISSHSPLIKQVLQRRYKCTEFQPIHMKGSPQLCNANTSCQYLYIVFHIYHHAPLIVEAASMIQLSIPPLVYLSGRKLDHMTASSVHGSVNKTLIQITPQNPIFRYKTLVLKKVCLISVFFLSFRKPYINSAFTLFFIYSISDQIDLKDLI